MVPTSGPDHAWLRAEGERLLDFARAAVHPDGGFGWLDVRGGLDASRPRELWVTCRMTHVFALAHLLGRRDAAALVDHGIAALTGDFRDPDHGGWYARLGPDGPVDATKAAYGHAFVLLAAASATAAGRAGAADLLDEALAVLDRFGDAGSGMLVEEWDPAFTRTEDYRGANANMHAVEALLAAAHVAGEDRLRDQALQITRRIVHETAARHDWRVVEHFDQAWRALPEYNRDRPDDPFRPYGATVGHWLEWARLAVSLHHALGDEAPPWLVEDARALFAAAVATWGLDGEPGFVYTVDWSGHPVVRQRMHWVLAEAIGAAAVVGAATGEASYDRWLATFWEYAETYLIDRAGGSWHHELDPQNRPAETVWQGKPDIYHAFQATLLPQLPLAGSLVGALRLDDLLHHQQRP